MPLSPRIQMEFITRLVLASALLWIACSELPRGGDRGLHRVGLLPKALQVTSGAQWSLTSPLLIGRSHHTATLLPSGQVLVTGGMGSNGRFARVTIDSVEMYDPGTGAWSTTLPLDTIRSFHTATLLPQGKVLVAGGSNSSGPLASAEVYDPGTGAWSRTGALATPRSRHTATLLPQGKVLVTGGVSFSSFLASAQVYDPSTEAWSSTGSLATARSGHTATLLPNGKVLVSGGWDSGGPLASAEVYDPATGVWSSTGSLATARSGHTATLLPSGKVLVSGGEASGGLLASAELYDPATGAWSSTGSLATVRSFHTATLLPSGQVLVTGGRNASDYLASAEVYDPATGAWSSTGSLATARSSHKATLLPSGQVLVTGGWHSGSPPGAEVYEDTGARQEWRPVITPPAEQQPGEAFHITGSRLRGLSEANGGSSQSSASNHPLVSLLALEGGALTRAVPLGSSSDTEVTVRTPIVPDGYYILSVMTNAIHGGQLLRVDWPPLRVPEITSPAAFVRLSRPEIGGTAQPRTRVEVQVDGAVAGTTTVDTQGRWSLTPVTELTEGLHRVVALAKDAVGNTSPESEEHTFTVDTVGPRAPVMTGPAALVNTPTPVIAGTAEPGSTVAVSLDGTVAGTTVADTAGTWNFTPATALPEGLRRAEATAVDRAGNVSPPSVARGFTVDTVPPEAPMLTEPGLFVNTRTPVIAGTADPGSTVTVWLGDDETRGRTAEVDAAGDWRIALALALPEGEHQVKARATDRAGNIGPVSVARGFTVDTVPPEAPVVTEPGASINTRRPVIRGTADPRSTVTVWLGDDETKAEAVELDAAGNWLFVPSTALEFGDHSVSARATDAAGNRSAPTKHRFVTYQRTRYGWSCTSAPSLPAAWALLVLALFLRRHHRAQ